MSAVDAARIFVISVGGLIIGISLIIIRIYARVALKAPSDDRLLPYHVALIGSSYSLLIGGVVAELAGRIGEPLQWRVFVYGPALLIGLVALLFVGTFIAERGKRVSESGDMLEAERAVRRKAEMRAEAHSFAQQALADALRDIESNYLKERDPDSRDRKTDA